MKSYGNRSFGRPGWSRRGFAAALAMGAVALLVPAAPPARAQDIDLDRAREAGWIGELPNGYLGVREERPGVADLVNRVNAQRRQRYRELALTHGVPLAAIERQAGTQLIGRLDSGSWYMQDNQWVRK